MKAAHVVPLICVAGLLLGAGTVFAIPIFCSDLCSCTTGCTAACRDDDGHPTTCGGYGLCVGSYGCSALLADTGPAAAPGLLLEVTPAVAQPSGAGKIMLALPSNVEPVLLSGQTCPFRPLSPTALAPRTLDSTLPLHCR